MKTQIAILVAVSSAAFAATEPTTDCKAVSQPLQEAVVGKPVEEVLAMLAKEVETTPKCACELVKSAIKGYKPRPHIVAAMVESAINAAPDRLEEIVQCALAAAPDAFEEVLDVAGSFGKTFNPLDLPGFLHEGPQGQYLFNTDTPIFVNPPQVTITDP